jgi:Protein of unknown function (DUF1648)
MYVLVKKNIISLEFLSVIISALLAGFVYIKSPGIIPTHFNLKGQTDAYGGKENILYIPLISLCIFFIFSFIINNPSLTNKSTAALNANEIRQVVLFLKTLEILSLLALNCVLVVMYSKEFGVILDVIIALFFLYNVIFLIKIFRKI